jgi:hypothetical protein
MPHFVREMKFFNSIIEILLAGVILLLNLIVLDSQCAMIKIKLLEFDL